MMEIDEDAVVSSGVLTELYCVRGLSVEGVCRSTGLRRWVVERLMKQYGITKRSMSQQRRMDLRVGLFSGCNKLPMPQAAIDASAAARAGKPMPTETRQRISNALKKRVWCVCAWCGKAFQRQPWRAVKGEYRACSSACVGYYRHFLRKHGPDAPRPVIVEKLTALVKEKAGMLRERDSKDRRRPNTWEQIEKVGAEIGAREPEIEAVHFAQMDEYAEACAKDTF
jgi:hypothetical protein